MLINAGINELEKNRNQNEHNANNNQVCEREAPAPTLCSHDCLLIENNVSVDMDDIDFEIQMEHEVDTFLRTKTTTNIADGLANFPTIKKLYMKFNSIRSTEAICERMFSYADKWVTLHVQCAVIFENLLLSFVQRLMGVDLNFGWGSGLNWAWAWSMIIRRFKYEKLYIDWNEW